MKLPNVYTLQHTAERTPHNIKRIRMATIVNAVMIDTAHGIFIDLIYIRTLSEMAKLQ